MMTASSLNKCIVCDLPFLEPDLMLFENMPSSAQELPCKEGVLKDQPLNLHLCQCSGCGLVQFNSPPVSYYKDVVRAGGFSTTMVELRRAQYKKFIDTNKLYNKKIIEVGAGQGEFLSVLKEFNIQSFGIEHNQKLIELAKTKGIEIQFGFAENEKTLFKDRPFDAFLSFNYLEHQPKPNDMLRCIYKNLTEDGVGLVTVPSFEYIKQYNGYYEFIRDHIAYYTFDTLRILFEKNGFNVLEEELINRDTLSIMVKKKKRECIDAIENSYKTLPIEINNLLDKYNNDSKKIAIWGASHQGLTIAATAKLNKKIEYIIDSAPFKQGKYATASHIPIVSPDYYFQNKVDVVIIIAPGYVNEIANIIKEKYGNITIYSLATNHLEEIK
jgi:2-polyprenyl-3-methyl-5-hydroxy-6-metoxy-1,4-benzoquinol methylase